MMMACVIVVTNLIILAVYGSLVEKAGPVIPERDVFLATAIFP